ncbi:MAG TPA: hypothetical protein VFK90_04710 [Anaeromyxobacter sp.]|nr:hypothetical protein [Anaeromyxobacter sp.]
MLRALAAVASLAAAVAGAAAGAAPPDPCRAARAPLPAGAAIPASDRAPIEAYRAAWRRACEPRAAVADMGALLGDAEALVDDVATAPALDALAAALAPGAEWPLPALWRDGAVPVQVDWAAFAGAAARGTVEDQRFWRGAAVAAGRGGDPAWLGDAAGAGPARCVALAETRWRDVADAIEAMERGGSPAYGRHARALRAALLETLSALARGRQACACLPGDGGAALEPLAADAQPERHAPHLRRELARAAAEALAAVRTGRVRVAALRSGPGAPPTGCAP